MGSTNQAKDTYVRHLSEEIDSETVQGSRHKGSLQTMQPSKTAPHKVKTPTPDEKKAGVVYEITV